MGNLFTDRMPEFLELPLDEAPRVFYAGIGVHGAHRVERYLLPEFWCLHLCRYHALWIVDGEEAPIEPGTAIFIGPNTPMEFRFEPGRHTHISIHFLAPGENKQRVLARQQLKGRFEEIYKELEAAVGWSSSAPARATARIWDVLWALTAEFEGKRLADPLVSRAIELIERRLSEPLSVATLAHELDVSHNHLTRQFRAATGLTPVDFIRERRIRHAQYLLQHSTLPIKAIASQSGLGDFHSFNKAMRKVCGCGPREWRFRGGR